MAQQAQANSDLIQPFQLENGAVRGRLVRLDAITKEVIGNQNYPDPVARILSEAMALAALLCGALKFDGVFSLQIKGDGPVSLLVADVTTAGDMRGFAQYDADRLTDSTEAFKEGRGPAEPVPRLLGSGYLAFTVDQGPDTERYQGIVELTGGTLADCAHDYFRRSVQMEAVVKLAAAKAGDGGADWRSAGLMVQRMPDDGQVRVSGDSPDEDWEEDWRRAVILMGSSTSDEMLDPGLHPHDLLFRLFHEDGVRVFEPTALAMSCRCSEERVFTILQSLPREEVESLKEGDEVVVTCEFCGCRYAFGDDALEEIYSP